MVVACPLRPAYVEHVKRPPADPARTRQTEHRWPDAEDGPWHLILYWTEIDGRPECGGISLKHIGFDSGKTQALEAVTTSLWRQVPVADFIASDRAKIAPPVAATGGLRKSTADRLARAAEVYRQAVTEKRLPTKAVAEHFQISQGNASNLVARARAAGLLPPASPGKANA